MAPGRLLADWGDSLTARYEKNTGLSYRTEARESRGETTIILKLRSGRKTENIELPGEAAAVLRWLAIRKRPFHGHEAAAALGRILPQTVIDILSELEAAGLIFRQPEQGPSAGQGAPVS